MNVIVEKLTHKDIPAIDADNLNGEHLVEYGYYKVSLADRPELYCYTREFGGLAPEEIGPYVRISTSALFGDSLIIDLATIKNDKTVNPQKTIHVVPFENVYGENTRIFYCPETKRYYMRISSYPREKFARWLIAFRRQGRWDLVLV